MTCDLWLIDWIYDLIYRLKPTKRVAGNGDTRVIYHAIWPILNNLLYLFWECLHECRVIYDHIFELQEMVSLWVTLSIWSLFLNLCKKSDSVNLCHSVLILSFRSILTFCDIRLWNSWFVSLNYMCLIMLKVQHVFDLDIRLVSFTFDFLHNLFD